MTRGAQQYQVYGDAEDVVTPQIHGAADPHRVHIVLDGLRSRRRYESLGG